MFDIFSVDSFFYRAGLWLYHFMYLNVLFIICCIPIITIYPSIAALFGVIRKWKNNEDVAVFSQFKEMFIENWKQSYLIGIPFTLIGAFLRYDYYLLTQITSVFKPIIFGVLLFASFLFILSLINIYPIMVHINTSIKDLWISSLKMGIYKIHLSIFCLVILVAWIILAVNFSFLFLFLFFSVSAYLMYWIAEIKFKGVESAQ